MTLLEKALIHKYRYATGYIGTVATEDLYDLPLKAIRGPSLQAVAAIIDGRIKGSETTNFVDDKPAADQELVNKLEIVKVVIAYRKAVIAATKKAKATRDRNQLLMSIKADKENDALRSLSMEEIDKLLEESA